MCLGRAPSKRTATVESIYKSMGLDGISRFRVSLKYQVGTYRYDTRETYVSCEMACLLNINEEISVTDYGSFLRLPTLSELIEQRRVRKQIKALQKQL